jgi:hypothetical protein
MCMVAVRFHNLWNNSLFVNTCIFEHSPTHGKRSLSLPCPVFFIAHPGHVPTLHISLRVKPVFTAILMFNSQQSTLLQPTLLANPHIGPR